MQECPVLTLKVYLHVFIVLLCVKMYFTVKNTKENNTYYLCNLMGIK